MLLNFILFSAIFITLEIVLDIFFSKFFKINGFDFLFFAPWIAGSLYGIYEGLIIAAVLVIIHMFFNVRIAHFILFSSPTQIVSVFIGNSLKTSGL